ncbi:MAG: preprotein translocase subunit SecG [Burkholderiaceae bacterium]|nr:preprotein translocase subunit SecG [Burkholderiaceae bacterium]
MSLTFSILLAVHLVLAVLLIGIILMQQGKGATAGAAFGSGASATVFGARGSASFLTRTTAILAVLFLANSMLLAYLYGQALDRRSLLDAVEVPATPLAAPPASPADVPSMPPAASDVPVPETPPE